ncbi:hypothetical protein AAFC00_001705 [Neodothiora populina]|uniref:Pentatricopeptide repeat-containing protein n=1 Tax=Neodothiora populina TaxID=2781224 RepID=A0ABR3PQY4_9PEZI
MPSALHRLLARPSALGLPRHLIANQDLSCLTLSLYFRRTILSASTPPRSDIRLLQSSACLSRNCQRHHVRRHRYHAWHGATSPSHGNGSQLAMLISLYTGAPLFDQIREGDDPFDTLKYEADVLAPPTSRPRLVDHSEHAHNMDLWLELLRFRKRLNGHDGVREIWQGMMQRDLCLPITGTSADSLWSLFIDTALQDEALLEQICDHASHLRQTPTGSRPSLYRDILGPILRTMPFTAMRWHKRMEEAYLVPDGAAASVFEQTIDSLHPKMAYKCFKKIYADTKASGLYDACMSKVFESCEFRVAFAWHNFFVSHQDTPSFAMQSKPLVKHMTALSPEILGNYMGNHKKMKELADARTQYNALKSHQPGASYLPPLTQVAVNTMIGDAHGIRQKKIGDAFCARLFATSAFSIQLVTSGLQMLGLEAIGALALREIAVRSQGPSQYLQAIRSLEVAGIAIVESTYSRALKMFAESGRDESFAVMVQSDQHPDSYEKTELQTKLFRSFLAEGKMPQAHATLEILTMSQSDPDHFMWNLLLQTYSKSRDRRHVTSIMDQMRHNAVSVSDASMRSILNSFLRPRSKSKRPIVNGSYHSDLDFVSNVFLTISRNGGVVDSPLWRELLRRYGMTNRFLALERLCLWIVSYHGKNLPGGATGRKASPSKLVSQEDSSRPLGEIFSAPLLRATIAWGFIGSVPPFNHERELYQPFSNSDDASAVEVPQDKVLPERWARGIALVQRLHGQGVDLTHSKIGREVKLRLWILFGPGRSASKRNRHAQQHNTLPLLHYVRHIEDIWGGDFFKLPRGTLIAPPEVAEATLYKIIFGQDKADTSHSPRHDGNITEEPKLSLSMDR